MGDDDDPYANAYYITLMIAVGKGTTAEIESARLVTIEIESFRSASGAIDVLSEELGVPGELGENFYLVFAHRKLDEGARLSTTFPDSEETHYCHLEDKRKL
eukprot:SAG22_NODE_5262_length_1050_cov_3.753943_1_plen_101_part_01